MKHDVGLLLDFLTYANSLPGWIKNAVQVYAAGGMSSHTICVNVADIDNLAVIKKKLRYYGLNVEFIRQHNNEYVDDYGDKPYTHFTMRFRGSK